MALVSLLVCPDAKAVQTLSRALREVGLEVEHCGNLDSATKRVKDERFDAVVLDCEGEAAAMTVLAAARQSAVNAASLLIAVVDGTNNVRELFAKGANFALYKPISA